MVKSSTKPYVDFKKPKYAPKFDTCLPHDDDKCCDAARSKTSFNPRTGGGLSQPRTGGGVDFSPPPPWDLENYATHQEAVNGVR